MNPLQMAVVDGPDKPSLQWAVAYPERELVHFRLNDDGFDAQVESMEEAGNGLSFRVQGIIRSGEYSGRPFRGVYSVEDRAGTFVVDPV